MAATDAKTISIKLQVDNSGLTSGFSKAKDATKSWEKDTNASLASVEASTERISHLWRSAFEAFIGFEAVDMLKKLAEGAAEAATQLAVAARVAANFGHNLNPEQFESWLEAFARSAQGGGYAIDDMRASVQQFSALGLDVAQTQRALADTANLAAARNISWAEATTIVREALTGHVEMLSRYGIVSREAAKNIHTVQQAMDALEKSTAGAAATRSSTLTGEFGRLATAASLLGDALGKGLEPVFDTIVNAITHLADAVAAIPQKTITAIATIVGFGAALAATALILPAIAKGVEIMREGFALLMIPINAVGKALLFAQAGFLDMAAGEVAALGPIAAVIAAVVGIIVVLTELTNHMDHVQTAWHNWVQYLSDSFAEFVDNFKKNHDILLRLIGDIAQAAANPAMAGKLAQDWATLASPKTTIKDGGKFADSTNQIGKDIINDWKGVLGPILNLFGSTVGRGARIPGEGFSGTIPGTTKDGGPAAAENALKNFEEALTAGLQKFADRVADAQHQATKADTAVDQYKAGLLGGEPQNAQQAAELQKLVTAQMQAQATLHDRLVSQQKAELESASALEKIASKISTHLKNHDELVRQASDAAREHLRTAQELGEKYLQIGVTIAKLKGDIMAIAAEGADNARDAANDSADIGLSQRNANRDLQSERLGSTLAVDKAAGKSVNPVSEDRVKIAMDQLAVAAAADTESIRQEEVARARVAYNLTGSIDDYKKLAAAQLALTQAIIAAGHAEEQRAADQEKALIDQNQKWNNFIDGLVNKVNMPGLSAQGGNVSFNPLQLLMDALEKTQAFADVVNTATSIVNTLAQAFEAFRPIIDALLEVVRAVANVFIFMYNAVARILDLFGLQIQQLQYLTDAMTGLVPLINIWHEIPTLNELAAGKLNNPLSTTPYGNNTLGQTGGGQNTLMKVVEILTGIFAAIVIEKLISGMSFTQAVQQTAHLLGINIGQKITTAAVNTTNGLITMTNSISTTGFATVNTNLVAILTALQSGALTGGGGFGSLISSLFGGGASLAGIAAGIKAPLEAMGDAVRRVTSGLNDHVAAIKSSTQALVSFAQAVQQASMVSQRAIATGPGGNLSVELSRDMSRRIGSSGYGLDRANVQ